MRFLGIVAVIWVVTGECTASILFVDINSTNPTQPYATWDTAATNIQNAVDVAIDGDTVMVTNGVYAMSPGRSFAFLTNAVIMTNAVLLRSVNGPAVTTIHGGDAMTCVLLSNSNAYLEGFTLAHGFALVGAGVYLAAGTVDTCVIVSNRAFATNLSSRGGGGAYLYEGARLLNSTIAWNVYTNQTTYTTGGGGVFCETAALVTNCCITFNTTYKKGGGVFAYGPSSIQKCYIAGNRELATAPSSGGGGGVACQGSTRIDGCIISSNEAAGLGGGIFVANGTVVSNCIVEQNTAGIGGGLCAADTGGGVGVILNTLVNANRATSSGGGAAESGSTALSLESCTISSNAAGDGGGLEYVRFVHSCSIFANTATNDYGGAVGSYFGQCVFSNNAAGRDGGGVSFGFMLTNCVVIGNTAGRNGGGIYLPGSQCVNALVVGNTSAVGGGVWGNSLLQNCTISGNHSATGGGVYGTSAPQVRNSIIFGNTALESSNFVASTTNITFSCVAPMPSGAGNTDVDPLFADASSGNYRLTLGSPCVDTGDASGAPTHDLDELARPLDGDNNSVSAYDMGAYEFASSLSDTDGDGMSDGNEVVAGTDPHNGSSVFTIVDSATDPAGWVVRWSSVAGKQYSLYHSTNLLEEFVLIGASLPATPPQNIFTDVTAAADANFYQVKVSP